MSNLDVCYYRQLTNIRGIVEECALVNRGATQLITKVLPRCEYFIGTTYGASKESYGAINDFFGGKGQ